MAEKNGLLIRSLLAAVFTMILPLTIAKADVNTGSTTRVHYLTRYRGKNYRKTALVYLPANYQRSKRYNVLYLIHAYGDNGPGYFRRAHYQRILDQEIASGQMPPTIVVFPTYYPSQRFVGNDYHEDRPYNRFFAEHEFRQDLIPAVEGQFSTYAKGTSNTALQSSRKHRAVGGYSMGGITSWYIFRDDLPYVGTVMPMAGDSWAVEADGGSTAPRQTAADLAKTVQQHPNLSFKILTGVGTADGTEGSMTPQIRAMWRLPEFNRQNLQYYHYPNGGHDIDSNNHIFRHYASPLFNN